MHEGTLMNVAQCYQMYQVQMKIPKADATLTDVPIGEPQQSYLALLLIFQNL